MRRWLLIGLLPWWLLACSHRPAMPVTQTDVVVTPAHWPQALGASLHRPANVSRPPVVLVIHGGGWVRGGPDSSYVLQMRDAVLAEGMAALVVSYRLAPEHRFPAQVEDIEQALRWLAAEASDLSVATDRVGLWGYSAGAHLATLVAARPQAVPIRAVVAGGTPAELRVWPRSPMVLALLGQSLAAAPERWAAASPVAQINARMPPHHLYHGRLDTLVSYQQALKLRDALAEANVPVTLDTRWTAGHILTALASGPQQRAAAFLRDQLTAGLP